MTAPGDRVDGRALVVRADATGESGTGHLMRSLALTQAWLDRGGRARWLIGSAPGELVARIAGEGVDIVMLDEAPGSAADAARLAAALSADADATGVIDGTAFGAAYLDPVADVADRILLIDDLADRPAYPVGFVLNQNAHAARSAYPADAPGRFLLGTEYVLLRREFAEEPPPRAIAPIATRLLVTFGGSDPTGMTARTIAALRQLPSAMRRALEVTVLVGAANRDGPAIEAAAIDPDPGYAIRVRRAVTDMPSQMAWADLAVTSGGSTVWELARCGVPALVVETVPAERMLVTGLARLGLFGQLGAEARLDAGRIAAAVRAAADDMIWREQMAALGRRLIDGLGAARVVAALAARPIATETT